MHTPDYEKLWLRRGTRLLRLAAELQAVTRERNMLAARCAEQAHQIAALLAPPAPTPRDVIGDAIRTMQRGGVR